ncbi:hypothetical protein B9G55_20075 [Saccharibacillus sp. O16]|nr:hypothetical protein B9G55_20075 [Saccharibacillus sp. O16]
MLYWENQSEGGEAMNTSYVRSAADEGNEQQARHELLKALQGIRFSSIPPESPTLAALIPSMLRYIGDVDSALRDEWIYGSFSQWIQAGWLEEDQLRQVMDAVLKGDGLFFRIGEQETDSVFTRSFSMLLIPLILSSDRRSPWLHEQEWRALFHAVLRVLDEERDLRGYVPEEGRGWAHAVAHTADALEDLAQSPLAGSVERLHMLEGIRRRLLGAEHVFVHDEDDRLAAAAETILTLGQLEQEPIEAWLERFGEEPAPEAKPFAGEGRINARLFLQRLEIRLSVYPQQASMVQQIHACAAQLLM